MPTASPSAARARASHAPATKIDEPKGKEQDAIAMLMADHKKVKGLFEQFKKLKEDGEDDEKAALVTYETTFGIPAPTSVIRITYVNPNATSDTAKKRAAWNIGCSWRAPNVQWRLNQKLLITETTNAITEEIR